MKPFTKNEQIQAFISLHQKIREADEAREVINTLEEFRSDWHNLRNAFFERVYPAVYWTYAEAYIYLRDYECAVGILEEGLKELEHQDFRYYFGEKSYLYELLSKCYVHLNERDKAYSAALKKVYNELYALNNTHSDQFEFYGFRDVSVHSLNDLKNETISLCSPSLFNDPVDTAYFAWMHYRKEEAKDTAELNYLEILEAAYNNVRARCLVRNIPLPYKEGVDYPVQLDFQREYANTVMWAHYANNHKGFCVKYVIPSSFTMTEPEDGRIIMLKPITYTERFPIMPFGTVSQDIQFKDAFLTKQRLWEYEHEHRLLYFDVNGSSEFPTPKLPVGSIKAVYIGVKCTLENRAKILEALKNKPDVEVYEMQINSQDIYKLKAQKIDRTSDIEKDIKPSCFLTKLIDGVKSIFN